MIAIYFHIPFCKSKCSYCDFYSVPAPQSRINATVAAMIAELELRKDFFANAGECTPSTIYFGGGTPSLLPVGALQQLAEKAMALFCTDAPVEFTVEVNPDDVTREYLQGLRSIGANRISIGIQSFSDDELRMLNRRHSAAQAKRSVELAHHVGFENISADLIFGLPNSTVAQWQKSVETAFSLDIQHLSAYALTIEEHTAFGVLQRKQQLALPTENLVIAQHDLLCEIAAQHGFANYEISNFAPTGYEAIHNSAYWTQQPYIGIGPAAHSYCGNMRQANVPNIADYLQAVSAGRPFFEQELLCETALYNEYMFTGLRTARGVNVDAIQARFGAQIGEHCADAVGKHLALGNLTLDGHTLRIPHERWMVSDAIVVDLMM